MKTLDPSIPRRGRPRLQTMLRLLPICIPGLVVLCLAGVWVRGGWVAERFTLTQNHQTFDPATNRVRFTALELGVETFRGVLGVAWRHEVSSRIETNPKAIARYRADPVAVARTFERVDTATLDGPSGIYHPFQRDRAVIGPTRTLHWEQRTTKIPPLSEGIDRLAVVAPSWVWMLPWFGPPLWWLWCPPGRVIPRLTIRRSLTATALVAVVLAVLAAFERSSATDRALITVAANGGGWFYGPDPARSGRPVVTEVLIGLYDSAVTTDADVARLRAALDQFPELRRISLHSHSVTALGIATLVAGLRNLESLQLYGSAANNATLATISHLPKLRKLYLNHSKVTDAGLVHLAGHPTLEVLELDNLGLTDAGLAQLAGLP